MFAESCFYSWQKALVEVAGGQATGENDGGLGLGKKAVGQAGDGIGFCRADTRHRFERGNFDLWRTARMLFEPLSDGISIDRRLRLDVLVASEEAGFEWGLDFDKKVVVTRQQ